MQKNPTPAESERLGAGLELSRYTPEESLAKAGAMFREMDLEWDLEQLEKEKYR